MPSYHWTILLCIFCLYPHRSYLTCTNSSTSSETDEKCYQGTCLEGQCTCFEGWTGELCDSCSGRILLTDNSGYITDGPNNYTKEMECSWLIQTTPRAPIRLRVLQFASECGWDYLYIYDGDSLYSPLLASFSGYVIGQDENLSLTHPEVVATSGSAFLYFYSDLAYHMQGFNISYDVNSCPQNCSGYGYCQVSSTELSAACNCSAGRNGEACQHSSCPANCSSSSNQGLCATDDSTGEEMCSCSSGYAGPDCSAEEPLMEGLWMEQRVVRQSSINTARSSHAGVTVNNSMWIFGGIQFGDLGPNSTFTRFNFSSERWLTVVPDSVSPTTRYGHSLISYGNKLLLFGGRETYSNLTSDELWEYDLGTNSWINVLYSTDWDQDNSTLSPLMLWGHTATRVDFDNGTSIMVVMFGFHPFLGYSGFIYEYDMDSQNWSIAVTQGSSIKESFGHSAAWDPVNKGIFVHGGFVFKSPTSYEVTDQSYFYNPETRSFRRLRGSGVPRYLHTGVVVNGVLYVYGGCTHNDTAQSTGALCYSPGFRAYLIACDVWEEIPSMNETYNPSRYGHTAVTSTQGNSSQMILYGGYNSIILHNILKYQTGSCQAFSTNKAYCADQHHPGLSCMWHNGSCVAATGLDPDRGTTSCAQIANASDSYCNSLDDCVSCFSSSSICSYCSPRCNSIGKSCNGNNVTNISGCNEGNETERYCARFRDCSQCSLYNICQWQGNKCQVWKDNNTANCPESCGMITSCSECASKTSCMWCVNRQQCLSTTSYFIQFPYGECMKWINSRDSCSTVEGCGKHSTCASCLNDPSCGWCDDGSQTGLGTCQMGASTGPLTNTSTPMNVISIQAMSKPSEAICPVEQWYFSECPRCQCNGHSSCIENTSECIACQDMTEGDQCQECISGYFGDATNGGDCETCQCYGRARLCNNTSGACFCSTKGATGDKCQRCDTKGKYYGDPANNGTCFYRLLINYSFTFSLTPDHDKYITSINFENTPSLNSDTELSFDAQKPCDVRVTVFYRELDPIQAEEEGNITNSPGNTLEYIESETEVAKYTDTEKISTQISGSKYGLGDSSTNATIRVYVSNFTVPIKIQISLVQTSNRLLILLLILFSCFLVLLLLTALAWKLKMMYDAWQRRRQHAVELEQMAARPFSTVHLCFDDVLQSKQQLKPLMNHKHPFIDAISEENCADGNASVASVIFWMPSGNFEYMDDDKSVGSFSLPSENSVLAVGTTILACSQRRGVEQAATTHSNSVHSRADKLKVVFKRGRGQSNEPPPSRHSDPCGHNYNQSNNRVFEHEVNQENTRNSASHLRHSKRSRSSFTSIRSVSVSPGECEGSSTPIPSSSVAPAVQHRAQPIILAFNAPHKKEEVAI